MSAIRCITSGLYQPECSCADCLREQLVNQLRRKQAEQPKEDS